MMNTDQRHKLLSMMGYSGPKSKQMMDSFINSSPAVSAKMGKFNRALTKGFASGGYVGYANGGYVMGPGNTIVDSTGKKVAGPFQFLSQAYNKLEEMNSQGASGSSTTPAAPVAPLPTATQAQAAPVSNPFVQANVGVQAQTTQAQAAPTVDYSAELNKIYNTELGRNAGQEGLNFYLPFLNSGQMNLEQVTADIQKNKASSTANQTALSQIFRDELGRDLGAPGREFYLPLLNSNKMTLDQVRADVKKNAPADIERVSSQNFEDNLSQIYQEELGRGIGSAGLNFYLPALKSGSINLDQVRNDVKKNASDERLIQQLFKDNLNREADSAGLANYLAKYKSGMTPDQIAEELRAKAVESTSTGGGLETPEETPGLEGALDRVQGPGKLGVDYWREQLRLARQSGDDDAEQAAMAGLLRAQEDAASDEARLRAAIPSTAEITAETLIDPTRRVTKADPSRMLVGEGELVDQAVGSPTAPVGQAQTTSAGPASLAQASPVTPSAQIQASTVAPQVEGVVSGMQAAQGQVSPEAQVTAVQQTESSVSQLQAAQGEAFMMDNPVQRELQNGELISGTTVDAAKVEKLNAQLQAAQATPSDKATVQGQLADLMQDFEGGATPAWASGAIRTANAILAQRGLGASSMAGQAVLQATMESALPIAQADAATRAQFESQNLSNRQQVAMFAAQQRATFLGQEFDQEFQARVQNAARVADIANMNFTAEQNIALENSRAANTMNLNNLSNRQAMVLAEAAALANLDMANLNNRQQAAVQNAQNFMQMDLTNINNEQQTAIFKTQQRVNALLSDQAATNAAEQFNAASENQTNQFFADLQSTISRFNADQTNAIAEFNAGEENAVSKFNTSLEEQRQQFEASNRLLISQANAKWRQDISTTNTALENEAIFEAVKLANGMTTNIMEQLWQRERDIMDFAFRSSESALDRNVNILLADKNMELFRERLDAQADMAKGAATYDFIEDTLGGIFFG